MHFGLICNAFLLLIVLLSISAFNMNSLESSQPKTTFVNSQSSVYPFNAWNYSKEILITPKTPVNNYQVKIELNSSNFFYNYANKDGNDLRFTDLNNNSLNYWIEQWQYGGNSTIWVKVTNAGTSAILMYYGNALAQNQSDGEKTFLFFDNFTGTALNLSKWQIDEDQYSVLNVSSGFVNLISTAPNSYYQYLTLGFDNLTLEHGQVYGNTNDTSVMLRNNQLVIHNLGITSFSNLIVPDHNWITGEIQWINSSFVQYLDSNNNNVSQLTTNMPQNELPISLGASGIINSIGTWYGMVLKSYFLAGKGTAIGFNCFQNTTYNSNEYPNLIVNWIYVRVLDNNAVYHVITYQQTNQNLSDSNNFPTLVIFGVLGVIGIIGCIVILRAKSYQKAMNKHENNTPWNRQDRIHQSDTHKFLCTNCNEKLLENDQFCGNCGRSVVHYKQDKL